MRPDEIKNRNQQLSNERRRTTTRYLLDTFDISRGSGELHDILLDVAHELLTQETSFSDIEIDMAINSAVDVMKARTAHNNHPSISDSTRYTEKNVKRRLSIHGGDYLLERHQGDRSFLLLHETCRLAGCMEDVDLQYLANDSKRSSLCEYILGWGKPEENRIRRTLSLISQTMLYIIRDALISTPLSTWKEFYLTKGKYEEIEAEESMDELVKFLTDMKGCIDLYNDRNNLSDKDKVKYPLGL